MCSVTDILLASSELLNDQVVGPFFPPQNCLYFSSVSDFGEVDEHMQDAGCTAQSGKDKPYSGGGVSLNLNLDPLTVHGPSVPAGANVLTWDSLC